MYLAPTGHVTEQSSLPMLLGLSVGAAFFVLFFGCMLLQAFFTRVTTHKGIVISSSGPHRKFSSRSSLVAGVPLVVSRYHTVFQNLVQTPGVKRCLLVETLVPLQRGTATQLYLKQGLGKATYSSENPKTVSGFVLTLFMGVLSATVFGVLTYAFAFLFTG